MNKDEKERVLKACLDLGETLMFQGRPLSFDELPENLAEWKSMADEFFDAALKLHDLYAPSGCDVQSLLRAIEYMHVHAMPPLRGVPNWFWFTLNTLLELAWPNYELDGEDEDFVEIDLRMRVDKAYEN